MSMPLAANALSGKNQVKARTSLKRVDRATAGPFSIKVPVFTLRFRVDGQTLVPEMPTPLNHWLVRPLTLLQLQRLKYWHVAQRASHPLEYEVWNVVLMVWLMGWIGWVPALTFESIWVLPLCLLGVLMPQFYVQARLRAHQSGRLRCDWLHLLD